MPCSHLTLLLLSYHGDGDPHSEAEGEVLSVRNAAFTNRQAVTGGETGLCHYCLRWGGEISYSHRMSHSTMLLHSKFKSPCLISADGRGLCSQRSRRPGERVSTLLCFSCHKKVDMCVCVSVSHCQPSSFRFSTELSSGLLEVISPPAAYYPDLTNLKETFGDSKERVR